MRKKSGHSAEKYSGNSDEGVSVIRGRKQKFLGGAVLIFAVCLIAYVPAMRAGFIWDDDDYVENNQTLRSAEGLWQIWTKIGATHQYYPMVHTSYWLEYRLWKLNASGYHVVNICLHAIGAILLWRVLKLLEVPGALVAATVFALHPVHVESVAWITERKNVLSGVFYLGAMLAYLRYALPEEGKNKSKVLYAVSLVLFLFALLSKTVTCTLPAALLLVLWYKCKKIGWREVHSLAGFFVIGILFGLLTVWMEKHHVGAEGAEWDMSIIERVLLAGRVLWFYAGKVFWPVRLTFFYPRWQIDAGVWQQYLYPAGAAIIVIVLWVARRRTGLGALVGVLFFAGTLVPALGFFDVYPMLYSYVADHFQYLASIGLIALAVGAGWCGIKRMGGRKIIKIAAAILVLGTLGVLTWRQCHVYTNVETLWRDTVQKNPDGWIGHNKLGLVLARQGKVDDAMEHFRKALKSGPDFAKGKIHYNLGKGFKLQGRLDEAISHYRDAVRLEPNDSRIHNYLGTVLASQGKLDEAIVHFRKALELKPDFAEVHNNLGNALRLQGKLDEAVRCLRQAVQLKGDFSHAYNNLGIVFQLQGKVNEAIQCYRIALQIDPGYHNAQKNLDAAIKLKAGQN